MTPPKIVILISGNGSNLQSLINAQHSSRFPKNSQISLVVSNRKQAYGLTRAQSSNIPTLIFPLKPFKDANKSRQEYDAALANEIIENLNGSKPDLIVLAGWMHILSPKFLDVFPGRVINLHPALPGEFDGANAISRAFEAFQNGLIERTGVMVHKVIPEVDRGEVIMKREVEILKGDTLADLEEKIHGVEHGLLVDAVVYYLEKML